MRPLMVSWPVAATVGFLLLQSFAIGASWSLPVLTLGIALAMYRDQLRLDTGVAPTELAVVGFLAVWLAAALLGLNASRSLMLSVPTLGFALIVLSLRRCHPQDQDRWALVAGLAAAGTIQSVQIIAAWWAHGAADAAQIVRNAHVPWLVVPNDMVWMACLWPCMIRAAWGATGRSTRTLLLVVLVVEGLAVWTVHSRLAWVCGAIALAFELALPWRRRILVALGIAATVAVLDLTTGAGMLTKGFNTLGARAQLWQAAWDVFTQHPLLGVGPHNYVLAYGSAMPSVLTVDPRLTPWPHSLPLELLAEVGLVGLGACCVLVWCAVREARGQLSSDGSRGALAGMLLVCLFEASTLRTWLWLLAALLMAWSQFAAKAQRCIGDTSVGNTGK